MKIFIDPGHNYSKFDTGSQGNGLVEQIVTYNVGKILSDKLKAVGIETKLSRTYLEENLGTDENTSLSKRAEMANNWGADYFISLHCDWWSTSTAKGGHCIIFKKGTTAEKFAEVIYPKLPEGRSEKIDVRNLPVLRKTIMPAVLIEMGFLTNKEDAEFLKNYEKVAQLIFEGICDYLGISHSKKDKVTLSSSTESVIKIDGQDIDINSKNIDGSIYVPIRKFCESLGYSVDWDNATKEANVITQTNNVVNKKEEKNSVSETHIPPVTPAKHSIIGTTHVITIDPRNIWHVETQEATNKTLYDNFVNSLFFMPQANGVMFPQGMAVNAGKILSNYATHGEPVATLIVYSWNNVQLKYITDITKEKDVWFAVSGYGIYPKITAKEEGFTGEYTDVLRTTDRPIIGYRKSDNKIVIAVRAGSDAIRANETAKNLGLDFAISLDAGGSTTLKVDGNYIFKGDERQLWGGIIWS